MANEAFVPLSMSLRVVSVPADNTYLSLPTRYFISSSLSSMSCEYLYLITASMPMYDLPVLLAFQLPYCCEIVGGVNRPVVVT